MDRSSDDQPRMTPDAMARWDYAYREGWTPWDVGAPQPAFVQLERDGQIHSTVLDVGCGTGEQALMLAAAGHEVVAVDISPSALAIGRTKAAERGLAVDFRQADALDLGALGRTFSTVIDCGCFHTFDDAQRIRYVESLATVLEHGGVLHLLCFSELTPGNMGPRRVTHGELRAAFDGGWRVERIDPARFSVTPDFPEAQPHAWLARIVRDAQMRRGHHAARRRPLPSNAAAGNLVAGLLAGVDHLVVNRPRPVTQIEEQHQDPWASADGMTVEGLEEPIERPEPPDRSGARL